MNRFVWCATVDREKNRTRAAAFESLRAHRDLVVARLCSDRTARPQAVAGLSGGGVRSRGRCSMPAMSAALRQRGFAAMLGGLAFVALADPAAGRSKPKSPPKARPGHPLVMPARYVAHRFFLTLRAPRGHKLTV